MLIKHQQGVGLLEVLVALLLLAVAVLGFSAMQMRSLQATNETLTRSDAMVMVRNVAEDLRLMPTPEQKRAYITAINAEATKTDTKNCVTDTCNLAQQTTYNAKQALLLAEESNINLGAMTCPGSGSKNIQKLCLIASWDDTKAIMSDSDDKACAKANGTYNIKSSCIVMETY